MKNYNFLLYFSSQLVSVIGNIMQTVVFPLLILDITGSGSQMGIVIGISTISFIIFSIFTGNFVDKNLNKQKKILATSDIFSGLVILGYILSTKEITLTNILILVLIQNIPNSFFNSANNAIFTRVVGENSIEKANSIMSIGRNIVSILAPMLGIFIYINYGFKVLLIINMFTFIISGIFEYFIKVQDIEIIKNFNSNNKRGYKEVFDFLKLHKILKDITVLSIALNFLISPLLGLALIYFINNTLKMGSEFVGYFQSFIVLGMIIGAFLVIKLGNKIQFRLYYNELILVQTIIIWVFYIGLNSLWTTNQSFAKIFFFLGVTFIGLINSFIIIPLISLLQEQVKQSIKGKFFTFYNGIKSILIPISSAVIGISMDNFSIYSIVSVLALTSILIQLYFTFKFKLMRRYKSYLLEKKA